MNCHTQLPARPFPPPLKCKSHALLSASAAGIYTRQELAEAGSNVVLLDGLQDMQQVFEIFGLT